MLRWFSPMPPSEADVPVERYTSAAFHQVEIDTVWTKVWQMACREEDIPEVGDHITYDIVGRSILVVRSEADVIKAFHNVCLHRGRRLREKAGRDTELRCAFHRFACEIGGCLKQVPRQWDFPRLQPEEWSLPEVRRAITPNGVPSPHLAWQPTEQEMFDAMTDRNLDEEPRQVVPAGATARRMAADAARAALRPAIGDGADQLSDAELTESIYYTAFPNFHPWGAYNRIVYRFRPYGNDHRRSIMECMFLLPFPGDERPPAAAIQWLTDDEDWTAAPELGMLGRVFNQDVDNLPQVQLGLEAMTRPGVTFADYQETKPPCHNNEWGDRWCAQLYVTSVAGT